MKYTVKQVLKFLDALAEHIDTIGNIGGEMAREEQKNAAVDMVREAQVMLGTVCEATPSGPVSAIRIDGSLPVEILTLVRLSTGEMAVEVCRLIHEHDRGTPNDPAWTSDEGATPAEPSGLSGYPLYALTSYDGCEDIRPEGQTWELATLDETLVPGLLRGWNRGDGEIVLRLGGRALVALGEDTILGIGDDDAAALRAGGPVEGEGRTHYVPVTAKARAAYDAGRKDEMYDIEHGFVLHNAERT